MINDKEYAKYKFENQWDIANLEQEINSCPKYDLYPVFKKYLNKNMKILESGCGLGRWVFYFHRLGYNITGMDWSQATIDMIKKYDETIQVIKGDARNSNFSDNEFDLILSLGTVEHSIEGPEQAINDAYRILKKDGILVLTVPILSKSRSILYFVKNKVQTFKAVVRGQYGKLKEIKNNKINNHYMNICYENNQYNFFEYRFSRKEIELYIKSSGFQIIELFPSFYSDGIYQDLRSLVGRWNLEKGVFEKNKVGKLIFKFFPKSFPHMICCIAKK